MAQGSYHQADVVGGGAQCACAAVVFLCIQCRPDSQELNTAAVDKTIQDGTALYYSVVSDSSQLKHLLVDELPDHFILPSSGSWYTATKHEVYSGLIGTEQCDQDSLTYSLLDAANTAFGAAPSCLLTMNGYTTSLLKKGEKFIWFDSHSRSTAGLPTPNGKSLVLEIDSIAEVVSFIHEVAKSLFGVSYLNIPFELVPFTVSQHSPLEANEKNNSTDSPTTAAEQLPTSEREATTDVIESKLTAEEEIHQPADFNYPSRCFGVKKAVYRSFQPSWFKRWPFLHYDEARDVVFCHTCWTGVHRHHLKTSKSEDAFVSITVLCTLSKSRDFVNYHRKD